MIPDDAASRAIAAGLSAKPGQYALATVHRPDNTDDRQLFQAILDELGKFGLPVLSLHPRTGSPPSGTASLPRWTGSGSCPRRSPHLPRPGRQARLVQPGPPPASSDGG
jgi:hypothetical protein